MVVEPAKQEKLLKELCGLLDSKQGLEFNLPEAIEEADFHDLIKNHLDFKDSCRAFEPIPAGPSTLVLLVDLKKKRITQLDEGESLKDLYEPEGKGDLCVIAKQNGSAVSWVFPLE